MKHSLILLAMLVALVSCSAPPAPPAPPAGSTVPTYLLNPAVTQATIATTICQAGWTKTVRPPTSYTQRIERQKLPAGADPRSYVIDHWIPLELGGAPRDERNLLLQLNAAGKAKDVAENRDHRAVCSGRMTLDEARLDMYRNWRPA